MRFSIYPFMSVCVCVCMRIAGGDAVVAVVSSIGSEIFSTPIFCSNKTKNIRPQLSLLAVVMQQKVKIAINICVCADRVFLSLLLLLSFYFILRDNWLKFIYIYVCVNVCLVVYGECDSINVHRDLTSLWYFFTQWIWNKIFISIIVLILAFAIFDLHFIRIVTLPWRVFVSVVDNGDGQKPRELIIKMNRKNDRIFW